MIEIEQALRLVDNNTHILEAETLPLLECVGHVTAKSITSSIDSPPYDKSMMDGFALRSQDIRAGKTRLEIIERILAGQTPLREIQNGDASQIMTGAPVPCGCDAVVMVEQTSEEPGGSTGFVNIQVDSVKAGQNILRRGSVFSKGAEILNMGHLIRPHDIGVLAEVGAADCPVVRTPNVGIVATGDELVSHRAVPGSGQIRNSNGPMLECLIKHAGGSPDNLGIAADSEMEIENRIRWGLGNDILLLTGGVSAGAADYVPQVLEKLGVKQIFHKVAMKPGKPIWFGTFESNEHRCLVFGLPGNPASSLVGFQLFVRLAMRRLAGMVDCYPKFDSAILENDFELRGDRTVFWPSAIEKTASETGCRLIAWSGSADIRAISQANGLARLAPGHAPYKPGDVVDVLMFDK